MWEFRDKDHKLHRIVTTPIEFARQHTGYDVASCVSLINDPRNAYDQIYTVERLGNVVGGLRDVRYINLDINEMKEIAIKLIQVGEIILAHEYSLIAPFYPRTIHLSGSGAMCRAVVTPVLESWTAIFVSKRRSTTRVQLSAALTSDPSLLQMR